MAEKLTPEQAQAVSDRGGKLLVSAAAGSGKTKVLVDRLLGYVMDGHDPADLDEFLIITYTKAAASELRGKIAAKLSEKIAENPENRHLQQQMQRLYLTKISTVHSFCSDVLREYAYALDIPADFRVADENECREIRDRVMGQILDAAYEKTAEDGDFRAFVDTQGLGRTDALVPEILLKVYDSARCHLDPKEWLQGCLQNSDVTDVQDAAETLWGKFLMEDLFGYLDKQIEGFEICVRLAGEISGWEKPAALLKDTLYQLRHLRESGTWDEVVTRRQIEYGRLVFPKKAGEPELAERIKAVREGCKKGLAKKLDSFCDPSSQVLADLEQSAPAVRGMVKLVEQFSDAYDRAKKSRRILDFGDLEHRILDLVRGKKRTAPTAIAGEIGARFREIMVDEYQDSNGVQDAIFDALTWKKQNLFMVGDVKQSIYQFRLADPGIFLDKYGTYVPAESARAGQGRKVLLSSNFRSGGGVISAVNYVFRQTMSPEVGGLVYGDGEALREGIPHCALNEPEVELHALSIREDTYKEEAAFVAQRIGELLDGTHMVRQGEGLRPIAPEDIVILLRSPGSVGWRYQQALEKQGIPCTSGGGTDLLETKEISTLRSILQIISNPRQDIPLIAALVSPVFEFSADDLASFRGGNKKVTMYEALQKSQDPKCVSFLSTLNLLRQEARMCSLSQLVEKIFLLTHMDSIFAAMDGGEVRSANLQAFYSLCADFEGTGRRDLGNFLDHLDAMEEKGLLSSGEQNSAGAVTIMSIHKSKGLEFPVVFLCGLSREFNRESARAQVLCHKELGLGLSCVDRKNRVRYPAISKRAIAVKTVSESLSEEMRVLYVAMTRARDRLIMTYSAKNLEKDLFDIANRMDIGSRELMTAGVSCPGQWVLMAAMRRTEAGAFFELGGRPQSTELEEPVWKICVAEAPESESSLQTAVSQKMQLPEGTVERLRTGLSFQYAYSPATLAPSKQTATQRKGRVKDQEAAENAVEPKQIKRSWRKAAFADARKQGKEYGSAIHAALQYIRYEACRDEASVRAEVERLVQQRFITPEQGDLVNCGKIAAFFATELGQKLRESENVLREFKFSILDDGIRYADGLEGEQVLLQGVVDCALIEEDGITIIDFKTDYVTEETLPGLSDHYRPQVEAYADALGRIYEHRVKKKFLYFFHLDRFVAV